MHFADPISGQKKGSALIHRDRTSQIKTFPFPFDFDGVFYKCRKSFLVCVFLTCWSVVAHDNSDFQAHPPERCCLFFLVMQNFQVLIEKKKNLWKVIGTFKNATL